jgi:hypothetical protein
LGGPVLCFEDNVAFLGQDLDTGLTVRTSLVLNKGGTQGGHAAGACEALRVPELVEGLDVGLSQRKGVVASRAL